MYFHDSDKYYEFRCVNFDIDRDGNFYVNFEADSMIYKYTLINGRWLHSDMRVAIWIWIICRSRHWNK